MSSPETQRDFYKFVIHVINASIIAFSFQIVNGYFIPFHMELSETYITNFAAMLFVWGVMISGWLGYTKSINDKPHSEGYLGNIRFVIDLVISFLMLYLFIVTGKDNFTKNFGEVFTLILPTVFFLYIVWDIIKNREYPTSNRDLDNILKRRQFQTLYAFLSLSAFSLFFIFYDYVIAFPLLTAQYHNYYLEQLSSNINWKYWLFMVISSFIIGYYRKIKGNLLGSLS